MARGSLPEEVMKEAAMKAVARAFDNAQSMAARTELLATAVLMAGGVQPDVVAPRRSARIHPTSKAEQHEPEEERPEKPETEDEPEEDPAPSPSLLEPRDPRQARVKKLKALLFPDVKVGRKRKHRAFNEVRWGEIRSAYMVDNKRLTFTPTPKELPPAQRKDFRKRVKVIMSRSPEDIGFWSEDTVKGLAEDVFTYAGQAFKKDTVKIDAEITLRNEELGVNGRADVVVSKKGHQLVVVECKRGSVNYGNGMAQMMLAAETLLATKIENDSEKRIYGLLAGSTMWTWMHLDDTEGRFFNSPIDPNDVQGSAGKMAEIAHGILLGLPITKEEEEASSNPGKRIKRL